MTAVWVITYNGESTSNAFTKRRKYAGLRRQKERVLNLLINEPLDFVVLLKLKYICVCRQHAHRKSLGVNKSRQAEMFWGVNINLLVTWLNDVINLLQLDLWKTEKCMK